MEVMIAGGAGFIGSHSSDALLDTGHGVTAIENPWTGSLANIACRPSVALDKIMPRRASHVGGHVGSVSPATVASS